MKKILKSKHRLLAFVLAVALVVGILPLGCVTLFASTSAGSATFTVTFTGDSIPSATDEVYIVGNFATNPNGLDHIMTKTGEATWSIIDLEYPEDFAFCFGVRYTASGKVVNYGKFTFDEITFDFEINTDTDAADSLPEVQYKEPVYVDGDYTKGVSLWKTVCIGGTDGVSYTLISDDAADMTTWDTQDGIYVLGADYDGDGDMDADDAAYGKANGKKTSFTFENSLFVKSDSTLILVDGFTLTVNGKGGTDEVFDAKKAYFDYASGITVNNGTWLRIYGQTNNSGVLNANGATRGGDGYSGISVFGVEEADYNTGAFGGLVINGGTVNATGGNVTTDAYGPRNGCGIAVMITASEAKKKYAQIILNGGIITATGGFGNNGHGGHGLFAYTNCHGIINGGTITATGGDAIYSGGGDGIKEFILNAGNITAYGGSTDADYPNLTTNDAGHGIALSYVSDLVWKEGLTIVAVGGKIRTTTVLSEYHNDTLCCDIAGIYLYGNKSNLNLTIDGASVTATGSVDWNGRNAAAGILIRSSSDTESNNATLTFKSGSLKASTTAPTALGATNPNYAVLLISQKYGKSATATPGEPTITIADNVVVKGGADEASASVITDDGTAESRDGGYNYRYFNVLSLSMELPSYDITDATTDTHGTVTVSDAAKAGETVEITATPSDGYEVDTITVFGTENSMTTVVLFGNTFTMPSYAVTVKATFKPVGKTVTTTAVENGTVSVCEKASVGEGVVVTVTPDNGYVLDSFKVYRTGDGTKTSIAEIKGTSFVMPDYDVTVEVTFKKTVAVSEKKAVYYNADGAVLSTVITTYDSNGNVIKEMSYKADGTIGYTYNYEYDEKGNKTTYEAYNAYAGELKQTNLTEYTYSATGKMTVKHETVKTYDKTTGELTKTKTNVTTYEYNSDDKLCEETKTVDGKWNHTYYYSYDGNVCITEKRAGELDASRLLYMYELYDENGNRLVSGTTYDQINLICNEYKHNVSGDTLESRVVLREVGTFEYIKNNGGFNVYNYDRYGYLSSQTYSEYRDGVWVLSTTTSYTYDENGNELSEYIEKADGTPSQRIEHTYYSDGTPCETKTYRYSDQVQGLYLNVVAKNYRYATVTAEATENGTVTVSDAVEVDSTVTLIITPSDGYEVDEIKVTKTGEPDITVPVTDNTFTMPDYDITVTVTFKCVIFNISAETSSDGTFTVSDAAEVGSTVTVYTTPSDGYEVDEIKVTKTGEPDITVPVTGNTFTMPDYDVTVTVTFAVLDNPPTADSIALPLTVGAMSFFAVVCCAAYALRKKKQN